MRTCPSCGGVIGRDCFNPSECSMITHRTDLEKTQEMENRIARLEERILQLETDLGYHTNPKDEDEELDDYYERTAGKENV